jgi:hypothetical protein
MMHHSKKEKTAAQVKKGEVTTLKEKESRAQGEG